MKRKNGFTLIELLVVISIIALLLSILLPSLSRVKKLAKRTVCSSRVKQLLIASTIFTMDNNDKLWKAERDDGYAGLFYFLHTDVFDSLANYIGSQTKSVKVTEYEKTIKEETGQVFACPFWSRTLPELPYASARNIGVTTGYLFLTETEKRPWTVGKLPKGSTSRSDMVLISDMMYSFDTLPYTAFCHLKNGDSLVSLTRTLGEGEKLKPWDHDVSGTNNGRMDGSVVWKKVDEMESYDWQTGVKNEGNGWWW